MEQLDIDLAIRVCREMKDAATVMALQAVQHIGTGSSLTLAFWLASSLCVVLCCVGVQRTSTCWPVTYVC
jgi:hypothetical protein